MPQDLTLEEFAAKVAWEGGVSGAIAYGLRSRDLRAADRTAHPDLIRAWDRAANTPGLRYRGLAQEALDAALSRAGLPQPQSPQAIVAARRPGRHRRRRWWWPF